MKISKDTLQPTNLFFYTLKIFGLAPYDFNVNALKVEMKAKNYVIFIFSVILSVLCLYAPLDNFYAQAFITGIHSNLLDRLLKCTILLQNILIILVIPFNYWK